MEQLNFIRDAGETRRFHTVAVIREQNIAEHSWHVAMLLWMIYGQSEPGIRLPVLMAALTHDMAEHRVGDIPAPAKRNMEQRLELKGAQTFRQAWGDMEQDILREVQMDWEHVLTVEELRMLKVVDAMDGALYCVRERAMGNQLITPCFMNFSSYIDDLLGERPDVPFDGDAGGEQSLQDVEWEVRDYIHTQWEIANGG